MPSTAELIRVADAITADLAAAEVAGHFVDLERFTPERSYADWADDLNEMEGLRVDVIPITYEKTELAARGVIEYFNRCHIGVRKFFPRSESEGQQNRITRSEIDRLVLFVQEIHEFFVTEELGRRLENYPEAVWQDTQILSTYNRKYLRDSRMFHAVLRLTYATTRTLGA